MALAETAQLLVKLTLKDETSATAAKAKTSISDLGKTALAVGGAAGFAALTKGALDAEAAQGKFMAATGKSREEAKQFVSEMDSLAGTSGAVGKSFEEIARTGTMVEQQFGTTGDKTRDLTEDILEYAKVTGSDATEAAGDLEDALSAFGLEADDATGFMDKLIASNQKYGTEAGPETLSILQGMAPALQAMGMELDDGVELLNAFEVAGLDAGTAQRGLQTAIKELKPGQNLDDLIAQIGAIEDPAKRAQKAIEIFGTKAGVGLAQVIKPGMTSLDDFGVSAEEAAGSLQDAADDMVTTSDTIRGMFDKLQAGARDLGQMFGPLITGIASLGTLMGPALGKALTAVRNSTVWQSAATGLGNSVGTTISAGILAGLSGAGLALGIQGVLTDIDIDLPGGFDLFPDWNKNLEQHKAAAAAAGTQIGTAAGEGAKDGFLFGPFAVPENFIGPLQPGFYRIGSDLGTATGEGASDGVARSASAFGDSLLGLGDKLDPVLNQMTQEALRGGREISHNLALGIDDNQGDVRDEWKQYVQDLKNPFDAMKEIAFLNGKLSGHRLAEGLNSSDPITRARAEEMRDHIVDQLNDLKALGYDIGDGTGGKVGAGLDNSTPEAAAAAARLRNQVNAKLEGILQHINVRVGITGNIKKGVAGEHDWSGGGAAVGAPVTAGSLWKVNEGGVTEYFQPNVGGRIIPLAARGEVQQTMQAVQPIVNVYITARDIENVGSHRRVLQGSAAGFR